MIIFDTSTLILLAKTDLLQLLANQTKLTIPEAVKNEALAKPDLYDAKVIAELLRTHKITVVKLQESEENLSKKIQEDFNIASGESEALVIAQKKKSILATDDGPAIKAAKIMGIPFMTTIHILIRLYEKGTLNQKMALAKLKSLENIGRYKSQIMQDARDIIQKKVR